MDMFTTVRPEHLNHYGYLFGGQMLKWVDEFAWIAASRDYAGSMLVTRAMNQSDFHQRVGNGAILRFRILPSQRTEHSVTYEVKVFADEPGASKELLVFTNKITFVAVDAEGRKAAIPPLTTLRSEEGVRREA